MLRRLFSAELLGVSAFLYSFSISSSLAQDAKQGAAEEILRGVEKVYATCKSYRDSGTVASEELLAAGKQHDTAQFSTAFVRPDSFRFEYQRGADERKKRYIIWANGRDVRSWFSRDPRRENKPESLKSDLQMAAGVTRGTSTIISNLLLADSSLLKEPPLQQLPDASFDGKKCVRFYRRYRLPDLDNGPRLNITDVYWIEKRTFLIRRIETETKSAKGSFRKIITYTPKINEEISAKELEFNPRATR